MRPAAPEEEMGLADPPDSGPGRSIARGRTEGGNEISGRRWGTGRDQSAPPDQSAPDGRARQARKIPLGPRFWRLWTGTAISSSGDGFVSVALPLLAFSLTRNPVAIAAVTADQKGCVALAALPAGLLADRVNRRTVMIGADLCSGAALAGLIIFMSLGMADMALLYLVAAVLAISEVAYTVALQASVPDVVPSSEALPTGNGRLIGVALAGEGFVGPSIGGVLFSAAQRLPFGADAASFLVSALLVRTSVPGQRGRLRHAGRARADAGEEANEPPARVEGELQHGAGLTADFRAGLRVFSRDRVLKLLATTMASVNFTQNMVIGLLVVYAERTLRLSSTGYGLFCAGGAVLGVAGSFLGGRLLRLMGSSGVVITGIALATISYLGMSFTKMVVLAVFLFGLQEFGAASSNVGSLTTRQLLIPRHLFGRVVSVQRFAIGVTAPLGAIAGGLIASQSNVQVTFFIAGSLQAVVLAYLAPALMQAMKRNRTLASL